MYGADNIYLAGSLSCTRHRGARQQTELNIVQETTCPLPLKITGQDMRDADAGLNSAKRVSTYSFLIEIICGLRTGFVLETGTH